MCTQLTLNFGASVLQQICCNAQMPTVTAATHCNGCYIGCYYSAWAFEWYSMVYSIATSCPCLCHPIVLFCICSITIIMYFAVQFYFPLLPFPCQVVMWTVVSNRLQCVVPHWTCSVTCCLCLNLWSSWCVSTSRTHRRWDWAVYSCYCWLWVPLVAIASPAVYPHVWSWCACTRVYEKWKQIRCQLAYIYCVYVCICVLVWRRACMPCACMYMCVCVCVCVGGCL